MLSPEGLRKEVDDDEQQQLPSPLLALHSMHQQYERKALEKARLWEAPPRYRSYTPSSSLLRLKRQQGYAPESSPEPETEPGDGSNLALSHTPHSALRDNDVCPEENIEPQTATCTATASQHTPVRHAVDIFKRKPARTSTNSASVTPSDKSSVAQWGALLQLQSGAKAKTSSSCYARWRLRSLPAVVLVLLLVAAAVLWVAMPSIPAARSRAGWPSPGTCLGYCTTTTSASTSGEASLSSPADISRAAELASMAASNGGSVSVSGGAGGGGGGDDDVSVTAAWEATQHQLEPRDKLDQAQQLRPEVHTGEGHRADELERAPGEVPMKRMQEQNAPARPGGTVPAEAEAPVLATNEQAGAKSSKSGESDIRWSDGIYDEDIPLQDLALLLLQDFVRNNAMRLLGGSKGGGKGKECALAADGNSRLQLSPVVRLRVLGGRAKDVVYRTSRWVMRGVVHALGLGYALSG
ncbi:unnamed protein product [Chrysoparadoxa australica]